MRISFLLHKLGFIVPIERSSRTSAHAGVAIPIGFRQYFSIRFPSNRGIATSPSAPRNDRIGKR